MSLDFLDTLVTVFGVGFSAYWIGRIHEYILQWRAQAPIPTLHITSGDEFVVRPSGTSTTSDAR